jgi:hypothetical protein
MIEAITYQESARLVELEKTIERGLKTFTEVGNALVEIRESRLYRIAHHTFEDYCRSKWGMTIRHADRLMLASKTVDTLQKSGPIGPVPITESQVRPLTKLSPENQPEAWAKAVEGAAGKQPTAQQVECAVAEVQVSVNPPAPDHKPPCEAMALAEKAIRVLEKIHRDDSQRKRAIKYVRKWIELNCYGI